jgi:protoporphyrinogen oxidase
MKETVTYLRIRLANWLAGCYCHQNCTYFLGHFANDFWLSVKSANTMRIAVIGAGPAGLAVAHQLAKVAVLVEVFEASSTPGGLAKTIELWGQRVDTGPHRFFSRDHRVNQLWLEVVGRDYRMVDRLTRILYRGRLFKYPLKPFEVLTKLGPFRTAGCIGSYLKEKTNPTQDDGTFENWVVRRFGRRLFEIFFESYSEKLWGISCRELDSDFAAQRIKKFSLSEAIRSAFQPHGRKDHKTLVERFAYPIGGTGMVYERMAANVMKCGGTVHYSTPVKRVLVKNSCAIGLELEDGQEYRFDHVVSTMPLTLLVERLDGVPGQICDYVRSLRFRNTILVYLHIDAEALFPDNWIYIHSPELRTGRITNFRNWVPELYGDKKTTILAMEYWCFDEDSLWSQGESAMIRMASEEIRQTGLIGDTKILDAKVYPIKRCYPVYERNYKARLKPIEDYLSTIQNLSVIGRYGSFKYNNQDHSILMGLLAADNILSQQTKHNLWGINTDYDDYQEASLITETGLELEQSLVDS